MASGTTIYTFSIQLSDVDRHVYADFELRLARHPSETAAFMLARVLAYCLEYREGIVLTDGIGATDEPAVLVRDLTGQITAWIEVGAPDAERLHRSSKLAGAAPGASAGDFLASHGRRPGCAVYAHRNPAPLLAQLAGKKIHRGADIPVYSFDRQFMDEAAEALQRRSKLTLSVTERQLYLDVDGRNFSTPIEEQRLA